MGTKSIDVMQTQHIALLEADMLEMKNKLNSLITEVSALSDKIGLNYTPATSGNGSGGSHGASTDPILLRLERLDTDLQDLETKVSNHVGTGGSPLVDKNNVMFWAATSNTGAHGSSPSYSPGRTGSGSSNLNGITAPTVATSAASITGTYSDEEVKVISIKPKSETRARKLARKTLNSLRK